jgi:hypothetical protein
VFAGLSAAAAALVWLFDPRASLQLVMRSTTWIEVSVVSAFWLRDIATTQVVSSVGDVSGEPLSAARVRLGMLIGWLIAAQGLLTNHAMLDSSTLLWATLAGLLLGRLVRVRSRALRSSSGKELLPTVDVEGRAR